MTDHSHHTHSGHSHRLSPRANRGRLLIALLLILGLMVAEAAAGFLAHSLALLSDAGHLLTDAGAICLSLVALRLAARPPRGGLTYGLKRAEILSALINGATLLVLAALIVAEAVRRLVAPAQVDGRLMVALALGGVTINLLATWQLARADRRSLNVRSSYQHLLTDLYGFIGTAIAGGVIWLTGFQRADPAVSLLVAALMVRAGYGLLRDAGAVLLEAAPAGLRPADVAEAILANPSVASVHDLHVWEITSGLTALTAHVLVRPGEDCHAARREVERMLVDRFGIEHTTLQVDHASQQPPIQITSWERGAAASGGSVLRSAPSGE